MVSWLWIPGCLIIGATIGVFMLALCVAAKRGDGDK